MSIKLECRDGSVTIPKKYYDDYLSGEWYFGSLVRFNEESEHMTIEIWENKAAVLSIFDSLRFMKLIVHDGVSLDYLEKLADMWCAPQWIIDNIKRKQLFKSESDEPLTINKYTFWCINCSGGYREIGNTELSCHHHKGIFNHNSGTYNCCDRSRDEEPCIVGYHTVNTYDYNVIYNMLNKNEDE
jgi:hypothetical protein